jgi:hypothetical protein
MKRECSASGACGERFDRITISRICRRKCLRTGCRRIIPRIELGPHHAVVQRQRAKQQALEEQKLPKRWENIVEPALGMMKQVECSGCWTVWGPKVSPPSG